MVLPIFPQDKGKQVGALPWRKNAEGTLEVLLITSRRSRRWLLSKGWPIPGKGKKESALQEAFEEAGIKGKLSSKPLGSYAYDKLMHDGSVLPCTVSVYAMEVTAELEDWPEMQQRERRWFAIETAASMVFEPGLAALIAATVLRKGRVSLRDTEVRAQ